MREINVLELEFGVDMGMNRFPDSAAAHRVFVHVCVCNWATFSLYESQLRRRCVADRLTV